MAKKTNEEITNNEVMTNNEVTAPEVIQIATGIKTYTLVGSDGARVDIKMNPTDANFAARLFECFEDLHAKAEETEKRINSGELTDRETIELTREVDREMRDALEVILHKDVITPLIGDINVYAFGDGLPIWANIILQLREKLDIEMDEQTKRHYERIDYYTEKYKAKTPQDYKRRVRR